MPQQYLPWPYAAKPVIQHEFDIDHLNLWLTFQLPMNQNVMPDLSKWTAYLDTVAKTISASAWQDAYTLLLTVSDIGSLPDRVLLKYDGPGPDVWLPNDPTRKTLEISYHKQNEPFGPILSLDITT